MPLSKRGDLFTHYRISKLFFNIVSVNFLKEYNFSFLEHLFKISFFRSSINGFIDLIELRLVLKLKLLFLTQNIERF